MLTKCIHDDRYIRGILYLYAFLERNTNAYLTVVWQINYRPHPDNDYRLIILKRIAIASYTILSILVHSYIYVCMHIHR